MLRGGLGARTCNKGGRENEWLMVSCQSVGCVHPAVRRALSVFSPPVVTGSWVPSHRTSGKGQAPGRPQGPGLHLELVSLPGDLSTRHGVGIWWALGH